MCAGVLTAVMNRFGMATNEQERIFDFLNKNLYKKFLSRCILTDVRAPAHFILVDLVK